MVNYRANNKFNRLGSGWVIALGFIAGVEIMIVAPENDSMSVVIVVVPVLGDGPSLVE